MNILITSVGRRTKLIEYFVDEFKGKGNVIATDCSKLAPALYKADKYYIVPKITDKDYIEKIINICEQENIKGILSLIDPELSLLSYNKDRFNKKGIKLFISPYEECELWLDKYKSYKFLESNNFNVARTYIDLAEFKKDLKNEKIKFPVFIKPRKGSASININIANSIEEVEFLYNLTKDMIIQEYLKGQEIGVDCYIDMKSKKVISICAKEKILMRSGETDKARTIKDKRIFRIVEKLLNKTNLLGPIDIDIFDVDGDIYISEINPRFGGGYPLSYEVGENYPEFILKNLKGCINDSKTYEYPSNIYMLKHDSISII